MRNVLTPKSFPVRHYVPRLVRMKSVFVSWDLSWINFAILFMNHEIQLHKPSHRIHKIIRRNSIYPQNLSLKYRPVQVRRALCTCCGPLELLKIHYQHELPVGHPVVLTFIYKSPLRLLVDDGENLSFGCFLLSMGTSTFHGQLIACSNQTT